MRRALRITRHIVVVTVFVVALIAVITVGLLHTDWGREKVRSQMEARLEEMFYGDVKVGKITGSVLGRFTAHGFELRNDRGEIVISAEKLTIDYKLYALLGRKFNAREIVLVNPVVRATRNERGKINLADLLRPTPPQKGGETRPWGVQIDKLVIERGDLSLADALTGETMTLHDLELMAAFKAEGLKKTLDVKGLTLTWVEKDLPIALSGHFVGNDGLVTVLGAKLAAGESSLAIPMFVGRLPDDEVQAIVIGQVTEHDLRRFVPDAPWPRDMDLSLIAARKARGEPIELVLDGDYGRATVAMNATLRPEEPGGKAHIVVEDLAPPTRKPFPGDLVSGVIDVEARGKNLDELVADVDASVRGQLGGLRVSRAEIHANLDRGRGKVAVEADTARGRATANARVHRRGKGWHLDEAHVRGKLDDLRAAFARPGLAGAAELEVHASGRLSPDPSLEARGTVRARGVRYQKTRLDAADVSFTASGLPSAARGRAEVTVKDLRQDQNVVGDVTATAVVSDRGRTIATSVKTGGRGAPHTLDADAVVRLAPRKTEIELGRVRIVTRGLAWAGRGGKVAIARNGAVHVDRVALASAAGRIEVDGDIPAARKASRKTDERLHLHVTKLDLHRVQKALAPEAQPIAGVLDVDAHVRRKGKYLSFDAKLEAARVRARQDLPALDVKLDAELGGGRLVAEAWVRDPQSGGALQLTVDGAAPRDATDARAWRRVDLRDVDKLRLDLYDLNVGKLMALAGKKSPVQAVVNGVVALAPGGRAVEGKVHVRDLAAGPVTNLDSVVNVTWDQDALAATVDSSLGGAKLAHVAARVEVGLAELQRGRRDFREAPFEASVVVDGYPVQRLRKALDLDAPMSGTLHVDAKASGTIANPSGDATVRLADGQLAKVPVRELVANASLRKDFVRAAVRGVQARGGRLDARAQLARGGSGAYEVKLDAARFDLAILGAFAPDAGHPLWGVGGLLDGDLALRGSKAARGDVEGDVRVTRGRLRIMEGQPVSDLTLVASAHRGRVVVSKLTARSGSGSLKAHGEARLAGLMPRSFWVEVDSHKLPVNAGRMVVGVSVEGRLDGKQADQVWAMNARVREAVIDLPRQRRVANLQKTGPLEDVVYVDERGLKAAAKKRAAEHGPDTRPLVTIDIDTDRPVAVRGREVRADVRVDMKALYRPKGMALDGLLEVQRGDIELFGRRYEVQKARLVFRGQTPPDPNVDVRLAHEFRTATVFINVSGTLKKPKLVLASDPATYDEAQLLGFVLGGDPDDPAVGEKSLDDRAVGVFSSVLAGQVQEQLEKALPIDVLRLSADPTGGGSSVEVGKWVTDDLFVSYRYRFGGTDTGGVEKNMNEAALEYRFARRWLIEVFFGDRGAGGADLLWTKRY